MQAFQWCHRPCCNPPPGAQVPLPLPWRALTTAEEQQRGITYYGSGDRLRKVASKLLAGQPIKVATLGGSVTVAGFLHRQGRSYAALFFRFINESFPHRQAYGHLCKDILPEDSSLQWSLSRAERSTCCMLWFGWQQASPPEPCCQAASACLHDVTRDCTPTAVPCSDHVFHNGGMPGSSSGFFAPCVERLVPEVSSATWMAAPALFWGHCGLHCPAFCAPTLKCWLC